MRMLFNPRIYLKKCFFVFLLGLVSIGVVGGCNNGSGGNNNQALTENDFADDPSLRADPDKQIIVDFLESPDSDTPQNDTGPVGIDEIPVTYPETVEQTFCWEDEDADAMHFMELRTSQESVILTVEANGECVTEVIEAGNYLLSIHHDGSIEDSLPIFLIPDPQDSEQTRETEGFIERFKLAVANMLKTIEKSITKDARAQTVEENRNTLLSTNSCVGCNLEGARLFGADLRKADLSLARLFEAVLLEADLSGAELVVTNLRRAVLFGADLSDANLSGAFLNGANLGRADLIGAILSRADLSRADLRSADLSGAIMNGVILSNTDFSGATWCDGSCVCAEGSFGSCNGCASIEEVCTGS